MRLHALGTLLVGIPVCVLGSALFIAYSYRRDALFILSRHASDEPSAEKIYSALGSVNTSCSAYTFGVKRTANILFRGQRVTLVFGLVGRLAGGFAGKVSLGPGWTFSTRLFALADSTQAQWMAGQPDVFSAAHLGTPYSVFWVSVKTLKRLSTYDMGDEHPLALSKP